MIKRIRPNLQTFEELSIGSFFVDPEYDDKLYRKVSDLLIAGKVINCFVFSKRKSEVGGFEFSITTDYHSLTAKIVPVDILDVTITVQ